MIAPTRQVFTLPEALDILKQAGLVTNAELFAQNANAPADFQVITLKLTYNVEKKISDPVKFNSPFRSLYVMKCTFPGIVVKMRPHTTSGFQDPIELTEKDVMNFGGLVNAAYFHWDAQLLNQNLTTDMVMTILVSQRADFKSGALSSIKGSLKTDSFANYEMPAVILAAGIAGALTTDYAGDQQTLLYWQGSDDLLLGNSSVSPIAGYGSIVQPNGSFKWNNKQILYGYSAAGGTVRTFREF